MCVNNERKPHKHAELIKAWADGAVIQFYDVLREKWKDCDEAPRWLDNNQYRIKPELSDLEKYGVEAGDVWSTFNGELTTVACPAVGVSSFRTIYGVLRDKGRLKTLMFRRGVVKKL